MQITRTVLEKAAAKGLVGNEQSSAFWAFLVERERETPSFKAAHILYYLGGMIAIGAMSLFMNLGWERFGGMGLLIVAAGVFWQRREATMGTWLRSFLPDSMRQLVERRASA